MEKISNMKKHFKLYKAGKNWCVAALTTISVGLGMVTVNTTNAFADANQTTTPNQTTTSSQATPAQPVATNAAKQTQQQATQPQTSVKNGPVTENGHTYYYQNNQRKTVYFNTNSQGKISYYGEDGAQYQDKFYENWGHKYYFGKDGYLAVNTFVTTGGHIYHPENEGILAQDKFYENWGHKYYFEKSGALAENKFITTGGHIYLAKAEGILAQNEFYSNWGRKYYYGQDGALYQNKSLTKDGVTYNFDKEGILVSQSNVNTATNKTKNAFYYNNGKVYFVKADGNFAKNEEVHTPVGKLYFDKNGVVGYTGISAHHDAFLSSIVNGAVQGWVEHGVLPSLTLAQAIIESGWGQSTLSSRYHNLFGIKASHGWTGKVANMPTGEYFNGKYVMINDGFRAYDNNDQSVKDHALFLVQNSRYSNLLWDNSYTSVTRKIQQDGYATAPTYATTLQNTIRNYMLDDYDRIAFAIKK